MCWEGAAASPGCYRRREGGPAGGSPSRKHRMTYLDFLARFWQDIAGWAFLAYLLLTVATLCWVLHLKREPMSAIAWCLTVLVLPFFGPILFALFGYQTV